MYITFSHTHFMVADQEMPSSPVERWGNWVSEKFSDLPDIMLQLRSVRTMGTEWKSVSTFRFSLYASTFQCAYRQEPAGWICKVFLQAANISQELAGKGWWAAKPWDFEHTLARMYFLKIFLIIDKTYSVPTICQALCCVFCIYHLM